MNPVRGRRPGSIGGALAGWPPSEAADRRWAVIRGRDSPRESVDPGLEAALELLEVAADRRGEAVAELRQVLAHLRQLVLERLGVDAEQLLEVLGGQVQALDVERALSGHEADRGLGRLG